MDKFGDTKSVNILISELYHFSQFFDVGNYFGKKLREGVIAILIIFQHFFKKNPLGTLKVPKTEYEYVYRWVLPDNTRYWVFIWYLLIHQHQNNQQTNRQVKTY